MDRKRSAHFPRPAATTVTERNVEPPVVREAEAPVFEVETNWPPAQSRSPFPSPSTGPTTPSSPVPAQTATPEENQTPVRSREAQPRRLLNQEKPVRGSRMLKELADFNSKGFGEEKDPIIEGKRKVPGREER